MESVIEGNRIHVNWLRHNYRDRWFADPFILDVTGSELVVLVEEWYDPIERGRISKLVIDRTTFKLKDLKVMLDDGTHLSFPAIERDGEYIYIYIQKVVRKAGWKIIGTIKIKTVLKNVVFFVNYH